MTMILRTTMTSPFGRKVRIAAKLLGLENRIEIVPADPQDTGDSLHVQNPLGKMPTLILENGMPVYDSRTILDHFDGLAGGGRIIPQDLERRAQALTLGALADGVMDAALLIVYEDRFRPPEKRHEPWVARLRTRVERGLAQAQALAPPVEPPNVGTISLACALGYLDWRKQVVDWRRAFPELVEWLERFSEAVPAFAATEADAFQPQTDCRKRQPA